MFVETSVVDECARRSEAAMKRQIDRLKSRADRNPGNAHNEYS
jgi:hypothetical protein